MATVEKKVNKYFVFSRPSSKAEDTGFPLLGVPETAEDLEELVNASGADLNDLLVIKGQEIRLKKRIVIDKE